LEVTGSNVIAAVLCQKKLQAPAVPDVIGCFNGFSSFVP
jgi:hypothetical protein